MTAPVETLRAERMGADGLLGDLVSALRRAGVSISPSEHIDFLRGVTGLELFSSDDLYWIGRITMITCAHDLEVYDQVFSAWCTDTALEFADDTDLPADESETPSVRDREESELETMELGEGSGRDASVDDLIGSRTFPATSRATRAVCAEINRVAQRGTPTERTRRQRPTHRGPVLDMRRVMRAATRTGGEVVHLAYRTAPSRPRKLLVLIDVSGSLKANSPDFLRFAHAVVDGAPRAEVYTFGTRLTRITEALDHPDVDGALARLSDVVFDLDGGTLIGASLEEFLQSGRRRTMARGAVVIVLSDGLERGAVDPMVSAVDRLARLAHRLVWLTPLASDPAYDPVTRAMAAIRPSLDRLGSSSSIDDLLSELINLGAVSTAGRRSCDRQTTFRLTPQGAAERLDREVVR